LFKEILLLILRSVFIPWSLTSKVTEPPSSCTK